MGSKITILAVSIGLFCGSLYGAYLHGRSTATAEIESEQAPDAIKHNAMELLGDRDRLIRFQEKFKPL